MSTEQVRAEFEEWARHGRWDITREDQGVYRSLRVDLMWQAWQASRKALSVELPENFEVEMGAYGTAEVFSVAEVKVALRAAGITVRDE